MSVAGTPVNTQPRTLDIKDSYADSRRFLHELIDDLLDKKRQANSFGTANIQIAWKAGNVDIIEVNDSAKVKFKP